MEFIYKLAKGLLMVIIAYLTPIWGIIIAVGIAIILDTILGAYKGYKNKKFSSYRLRIGLIPKMLTYQIIIIGVYIIDDNLISEFSPFFSTIPLFFTKITALSLIIIELISGAEKYEDIYGSSIIKTIKSIFNFVKNKEYKK